MQDADIRTAIKNMMDSKTLTPDQVIEAVKSEITGLENPGFCIACGHQQEGCEPDAREYECDICGEHAVFGAAEVLLYL